MIGKSDPQRAAFAHDVRAEPGARDQRAAVVVAANVGALPEEPVDQIAVRGVKLDAVETGVFRVHCGAGIGIDHAIDLGERHRLAQLLPWPRKPRGADVLGLVPFRAAGQELRADVP